MHTPLFAHKILAFFYPPPSSIFLRLDGDAAAAASVDDDDYDDANNNNKDHGTGTIAGTEDYCEEEAATELRARQQRVFR